MIHNVSPQELPYLLEAEGKNILLIDVRERFEFDVCHIPGSFHLPISGALVDGLEQLDSSIKHWIFVCQHGVRSYKAAQMAEALDRPVTISHVVGGMAAWSKVHPFPSECERPV